MPKLSRADIAALIRDNPDATEAELVQLARSRQSSPWVGIKNKARSWWETANRPLVDLPINATSMPGRFAEGMVEGLTSPLGLASLVTGLGAAGAAAKGLMGLSRAGALAEMGLNAPALGHGVYTAATGETPGMKGAGALEAALSSLGLAGGGRVLAQAARAKKTVPDILALTREHTGASVHPTKGNLAGQPLVSVGGVVKGEVHPGAALNEDLLNQFVNRKARALKDDRFLGTWNNPEDAQLYLDVSEALPRTEAIKRGLQRGEKAVFDLSEFKDINLNELPAADMRALIDDLLGPQRMLSDPSAVRGVPRILADETGAVGPNVKAPPPPPKAQVPPERFAPPIKWRPGFKPRPSYSRAEDDLVNNLLAQRTQLGQHLGVPDVGTLMPQPGKLKGLLQKGTVGEGGQLEDLVLAEAVPGIRMNARRPLSEVLRVGTRTGARLDPQTVKRLDVLRKYAEGNLDPREIDWTDPAWKNLFSDPKAANEYAAIVAALSPQVTLRPNLRDAMSATFHGRMGLPDEGIFNPFGHQGTGFGVGLPTTKLPNLRRARAGQPIGTAFPTKTDEFRKALQGDPDALPWDMHLARAMGLNSEKAGTPLQYFLMKEAFRKYADESGEAAFPLMAKIWSAQKHATARHEPGFTQLVRQIGQGEPDFLKGFTPRNEREFFEAMNRINELLGLEQRPLGFTEPRLF